MLALNKLYLMDCMEGMSQIPDKYFELAIVDPPYGIGEDGSKNHSRSALAISKNYKPFGGNDSAPPPAKYFIELQRVSNNQIIWGANHFIGRIPLDSHCWVVWDKENGATDFADCELAWTSFATAVRKFAFRWQGMLQGDMSKKEKRIHPTQKPVALYKWLLSKYAKPGDKILDTHVGSASSLIACYEMGFEFCGFEINPDYHEAASKRLEEAMAQTSLFSEATMSYFRVGGGVSHDNNSNRT